MGKRPQHQSAWRRGYVGQQQVASLVENIVGRTAAAEVKGELELRDIQALLGDAIELQATKVGAIQPVQVQSIAAIREAVVHHKDRYGRVVGVAAKRDARTRTEARQRWSTLVVADGVGAIAS